ncbi:stage II sporulation protein R [Thermoflavimicrobium dichotomicum]|uniref:Stage II sporulation protein R n=1 Tax=Thermoflavimicrobium dichotomicum TaxID=46223 RepID=A0A1I3K3B9_9BACL|nr:stage II sporulation protein R [Thermoflavimicrobium dichotomicum]SFI66997.1 stage II sporulation protein R [Thermoflavimicrobium dichotomicum]
MKKGHYFFLFIFVIMGLFSFHVINDEIWAGSKVLSGTDKEIPEQAIRLRILANSDTVQDQWLKRKVRDQVVEEIQSWAAQPRNLDEARKLIGKRIPLFQQIAEQTVRQYGFTYPVKVDFGQVPFPTKLYGEKVYPAGNYEALRITLGKGEGDNWWCVLFPPLCFVDMGSGEAIPKKSASLSASLTPKTEVLAAAADEEVNGSEPESWQVRFLLVEQLTHWCKKWF